MATANKTMSATKVVIPCRISFANIFEPKSINGSEAKYSVSCLIPKTDKKILLAIHKAIEAAKEDGKTRKWSGKIPPNLKMPLRDGDIDRPDDENYQEHFFLNATSKDAPQVVDRHVQPMAITKKIEIDGQQVDFRASAAVPRLYRIKFGRDIYKDLRSLEKSVGDNDEESSSLDLFSLEMFENIAYIMAKHAHPDQVPDTPDEWLENFNTFSIYQILPQLIELWGLNVQTEVEARKNLAKVSG